MTERNSNEAGERQERDASHDDGGQTRRTFLGAAAAATGGLLVGTGGATATDSGYTETDCGSVQGQLNDVIVAEEMNDGPLKVKGVHEDGGWSGVDLVWSSGPVRVSTGLDPDAARDLADRLITAADAAEGETDD